MVTERREAVTDTSSKGQVMHCVIRRAGIISSIDGPPGSVVNNVAGSSVTVRIPRAVINRRHDLVHYTRRVVAGATIVAAFGEIDASNVHDFHRDVRCSNLAGEQALIVDLSAVTFFSAQGLRALLTIGQRCDDSGIPWAVVPSPAVARTLLHIGRTRRDAVHQVTSVHAALSALLTAQG